RSALEVDVRRVEISDEHCIVAGVECTDVIREIHEVVCPFSRSAGACARRVSDAELLAAGPVPVVPRSQPQRKLNGSERAVRYPQRLEQEHPGAHLIAPRGDLDDARLYSKRYIRVPVIERPEAATSISQRS